MHIWGKGFPCLILSFSSWGLFEQALVSYPFYVLLNGVFRVFMPLLLIQRLWTFLLLLFYSSFCIFFFSFFLNSGIPPVYIFSIFFNEVWLLIQKINKNYIVLFYKSLEILVAGVSLMSCPHQSSFFSFWKFNSYNKGGDIWTLNV